MHKDVDPLLSISAFVMISIYIVLSLELLDRASIALLGAVVLVASAIGLQVILPEKSLEFIVNMIDFNTIGLLLAMMIVVAILGETGIFNWVAVKASEKAYNQDSRDDFLSIQLVFHSKLLT